jgi:O-antigen/teichoic acid export membrane protein
VLTVCWCFVADIAIFIKNIFSFRHRILTHGILMACCVIASIVVMALIIAKEEIELDEIPKRDKAAHVVIGYLALAWVIMQMLSGLISQLMLWGKVSPKVVVYSRKFHAVSGFILVWLCKAEAILGWAMNDEKAALGVVVADIVLVFVLVSIYRYCNRGDITPATNEPKSIVKDNDKIQELMRLPYNSPQVQ